MSRLWLYNLHYLDYLWDLPHADACRVAQDWLACNPPERGGVGWEPYPVSVRLTNLCGVFGMRDRAHVEHDAELAARLWKGIFEQAAYLSGNLETHLLGNHLLENGVALTLCGTAFRGEAAQRWRRRGLAILKKQLPEQILADGLHFERSPMYHARACWLLGMLVATGDPDVAAVAREPLGRALRALALLRHPDGDIPLLNDSARNVVTQPQHLLDWARRLGMPVAETYGPFALRESGYYGGRTREAEYLVCDYGRMGPDYQPGHAHGDLFSFEFSSGGRRLVVDSGVSTYERGPMRDYARSTRAHNTVEIDRMDQAEFWAAHRVARRGVPRDVRWRANGDGFEIDAWHDGYRRLPSRAVHRRRFAWAPGTGVDVEDEISARRPVACVSRIHLFPGWQVSRTAACTFVLRMGGKAVRIVFRGPGACSVEPSLYCPAFGRATRNACLVQTLRGDRVQCGFRIEPER